MAEVTVFVDDVVLGRLPPLCVKEGISTADQLTVRDASGGVIAAMNVSAYSLRAGPDVLEKHHLPLLRESVSKIERELRAPVQLGSSAPA